MENNLNSGDIKIYSLEHLYCEERNTHTYSKDMMKHF